MSEVIPCILERKIVPKVWGGRTLEQVLGIELPAETPVGETWEVYDRPDESSRIRGSQRTLHDLLRDDPVDLLGSGIRPTREGRFPLAVKFLDATEALSVQVHPDDEQAREEGDSGKAEAWIVLRAGPQARMMRGFRAGVTREGFTAVASSEGVTELLQSFAPRPGDCVRLPAGTVHTLGPDVVVFEVQRNSDVTYRLFDWGRPREKHLEKGLRAARFDCAPETVVEPVATGDGGEWLVRDPHFEVRRYALNQPRTFRTEGSFKLLTLLTGRAIVGWRSQGLHDPLPVGQADTVLVPASTGEVFVSPVGETHVVVCGPGGGR